MKFCILMHGDRISPNTPIKRNHKLSYYDLELDPDRNSMEAGIAATSPALELERKRHAALV